MSKFLDSVISLPGLRQIFQTKQGATVLNNWNEFWQDRADSIQSIMDVIPGQIDDVFLQPLKAAAIWIDPVVEESIFDKKTKSFQRMLRIVDHEFLNGFMIFDFDGSVKKGRLEMDDPKKLRSSSFYRLNSHKVSAKVRRFLPKGNSHGHKGRGEGDHLILIEEFSEKLFRELDQIKSPIKLRRRFFGLLRKHG